MRDVDRQRRGLELEQEIAAKMRELEDIERKINDEAPRENANPNKPSGV